MSCGEIDIQFPFSLKGANYKGGRCNYPDPSFQLSCDNLSRTILTLPHSGNLLVKKINYEEQIIQVNDPNECLPKRFLQNLTFSISIPFIFDVTVYDFYNLVFVKCPSNITDSISLPSISCLQETNSSFLYYSFFRSYVNVSDSSSLFYGCEVISASVVVPFPNMLTWPIWPNLNSDIELIWDRPICGDCAARSQLCGFVDASTSQVGCISDPNHTTGLSRSLKYGLSIGVGIPALLCIIGLSCFICKKFKIHHRPNTELPNNISVFTLQLQPSNLLAGLDGPEIEKFPKTLIGESGRLPKPSNNMCPICLSEYEPKEMLRTIPECNHYFHALCIDEWLKMNATCPLCRNSPDAASSNVASIDDPSPNHTLHTA
ncbi:hypothetical protein TanjilG_22923 [Lupinus angustifolius]|uniref:RING-type E3 ubiquitin transferase n=2 Tax=Lupinus angustifolius TaxID=3871 RepID=A0A1J7HEP0_LUPAN|nr:hypothetical protein TanjilG_22923 [Lupinus angustifolius]